MKVTVLGFKSDTLEYKQLLAGYGDKLEEHLEELGLLATVYTLLMNQKKNEFVVKEFAKRKKYEPRINVCL